MAKVDVLIEVERKQKNAFGMHSMAVNTAEEAFKQSEEVIDKLSGFGIDLVEGIAPIPMFAESVVMKAKDGFAAFASLEENPDLSSESVVVAAQVERSQLDALAKRSGVKVWPNSKLDQFGCHCTDKAHSHNMLETHQPVSDLAQLLGVDDDFAEHPFDAAPSAGGVDCRPFLPGVTRSVIRILLGVSRVWRNGYRGQNIVVGIIDEGVNGQVYPVVGGYSGTNAPTPGSALITSHGSMVAADILVAAPGAKLYDYPFLAGASTASALTMFQAVLDQRRQNGTPHLTNNSYGFYGYPPQASSPNHEVWNINHPIHRKVREVIASGAPCFFAAGNCGADCPSGKCRPEATGPAQSIRGSNSLPEVISVAAVNSRHQRIGYSSQGPGGFDANKPDVAAYSHFFGNFGPGRPGGNATPFDNGTSAASPLAAGVGALLMSAIPGLTPMRLKAALIQGATNLGVPGWDSDTGAGVINAAVAYNLLNSGIV